MAGGMTAGEAIVFWLGGFSQDPKFPISGEGGPSYDVQWHASPQRITKRRSDRKPQVGFSVQGRPAWYRGIRRRTISTRIQALATFEYNVTVNGKFAKAPDQFLAIRAAEVGAAISVFRHVALYAGRARLSQFGSHSIRRRRRLATGSRRHQRADPFYVFAFKKRSDASNASSRIQFINPDKFQIIHCGINDRWDEDTFKNRMSMQYGSRHQHDFLTFPDGPFSGDIAETIVNFTTETKIEDAQK